MKLAKIGDFLKRSKIPVEIQDDEEYKRVTIRINHNGVSLRDTEKGKKIGTKKQFILKSGQFIVSKIDARYGAFGIAPNEVNNAIITGNFWAFDVDFTKVNIEWFNQFTNSKDFYDLCERASSGITHRKYLDESFFLNYEILLPSIDEQLNQMYEIKNLYTHIQAITTEQEIQLTHLKQLRQQILSDAMQGKLDVPHAVGESGVDLLARIQAEKAKTVKKAKTLPEIKADDISFTIPEHWVWCRLGEICRVKVGATPSRSEPKYWKGDIPWVASGEVANNYIYDTKEKISQEGFNSTSLIMYPKGSVLVAMIGQGKTRGQTAVLKIDATTNQNVAGLVIEHKYLLSEYLWYFFLSRYETTRSGASGGNQPALNGIKISNTLFPLPPMSEQIELVRKMDHLMALCDELEASIRQNQEYTQMLYQTTLREALQKPA